MYPLPDALTAIIQAVDRLALTYPILNAGAVTQLTTVADKIHFNRVDWTRKDIAAYFVAADFPIGSAVELASIIANLSMAHDPSLRPGQLGVRMLQGPEETAAGPPTDPPPQSGTRLMPIRQGALWLYIDDDANTPITDCYFNVDCWPGSQQGWYWLQVPAHRWLYAQVLGPAGGGAGAPQPPLMSAWLNVATYTSAHVRLRKGYKPGVPA